MLCGRSKTYLTLSYRRRADEGLQAQGAAPAAATGASSAASNSSDSTSSSPSSSSSSPAHEPGSDTARSTASTARGATGACATDEAARINELIRAHQAGGGGSTTFRERRKSFDGDAIDAPKKPPPPQHRKPAATAASREMARINELIARKNIERAQKLAAQATVPPVALKSNTSFGDDATPTPTGGLSPSSSSSEGASRAGSNAVTFRDEPTGAETDGHGGAPESARPPHHAPETSRAGGASRSALVDDAPKSQPVKEGPSRDTTRRRSADLTALAVIADEPEVQVGYNARGTARATRRFRLLLHMRNLEKQKGATARIRV
jgi:hypothetical protein